MSKRVYGFHHNNMNWTRILRILPARTKNPTPKHYELVKYECQFHTSSYLINQHDDHANNWDIVHLPFD